MALMRRPTTRRCVSESRRCSETGQHSDKSLEGTQPGLEKMGAKKASIGRDMILLSIEQHPLKMLQQENQSEHSARVRKGGMSAEHDRT